MLAKTKKVQLTIEELNTLLTGNTDNNKVDTIPEMAEAFESGYTDMQPMTNSEIENIINNLVEF